MNKMNKRLWLGVVFLLAGTSLGAVSQFRIDAVSPNSKFVLHGKPSATVGVMAFMQEGLDYLTKENVVYQVSANVSWQNFLAANGVRVRPRADRYALRSDRYYRFNHVQISAIKPYQPQGNSDNQRLIIGGLLAGLAICAGLYLFWPAKKNIKLKKINRPKLKISRIKTIKKIKRKSKLKPKTKLKTKIKPKTKPKVKIKTKTKPKVKPKKNEPQVKPELIDQIKDAAKKSKSILIKPTANRVKNIKLARKLALRSLETKKDAKGQPKKELSINDFIQEDVANAPPTLSKTELREGL